MSRSGSAACATASTTTTILRGPGALQQAEPIWRTLWQRSDPLPPMLEHAWAREWWAEQGRRGRPFIVVVEAAGQPIGLAPLYVRRRGPGAREILRTVAFIGTGEPEAEEVATENTGWLCAPEDAARVTDAVAASLRDNARAWDALSLRYLGPRGDVATHLARRLEPVLLESELRSHVCHGVDVVPFEEYAAAIESSSRRARYRRWMRRAEAAGVELVLATGRAEALEMFDALLELHGRQWQQRGRPGAASSSRFRRFHRRMIEHYAAEDRLWVFGLRHEGRWIGLHYDIAAGDTLYYYLSGIDTDAAGKLAPGNVLLLHAIDQAARSGFSYLDLLAGAYDFKAQLATASRQTVTLTALNRSAAARAWRAAREFARRRRGSIAS